MSAAPSRPRLARKLAFASVMLALSASTASVRPARALKKRLNMNWLLAGCARLWGWGSTSLFSVPWRGSHLVDLEGVAQDSLPLGSAQICHESQNFQGPSSLFVLAYG